MFNDPLSKLAEYRDMERDLLYLRGPLQVGGLSDGAKAYMMAVMAREDIPKHLVITYDESRARELAEDIACYTDNVYLYPARDLLFFAADIRGGAVSAERIDVRRHMVDEKKFVTVTTIDALMDKLEEPEQFRSQVITIHHDDTVDIDSLAQKLSAFGYQRGIQVEGPGEFAVRGGIIDIYPLTEPLPVRIELWDDQIDSMRSFDAESQRSVDNKDCLRIFPAREKDGGRASFLRYLDPDSSLILIDEPDRCAAKAREIEEEFREGMAGRIESGQVDAGDIPDIFTADEVMEDVAGPRSVCMTVLDDIPASVKVSKQYSVDSRNSGTYHNAFDMLISDIGKYIKAGYSVAVLSASRTRTQRLADDLRSYDIPAYCPDNNGEGTEIGPGQVAVMYGSLHRGFEFPLIRFVLISESDIFGVRKKKKFRRKFDYEASRITSLAELHPGDYVVHESHGMGIYRGIEKIEMDGVTKDYMKIGFAGESNCYVPVTKLEVIQKYAGAGESHPKLNRLGSDQWKKTKARVKKAVEEIARELVELYAVRLNGEGYKYGPDTVWQKEFEEMFEFEETEDQKRAIEDTKHDMESGRIMDRLICGDVGFGKTEIALRAAFKVIQEGRQVIYLVPTTILAQQHYNTFIQRMKDFPVRVELLSRFRTPAQQKKAIEEFSKGLVDIIIGTHRVLSADIKPKALGLVVVDEEQRFGVKHKEALKQLKKDVNVLTLTATPIPRTLHMSLSGIRDMSVLEEPPQERRPIQTYVMEYNQEVIREAIGREIKRGGQVYYVYNRVNSIAEITAQVQALVPDASVAFAHGQMSERELETVMMDFVNGEIDVLVSTTIIETGLDIPNVNTMIVHDADRLGLSQLYQLRGRVGRSSRTAYAFLFYKRDKLLNEDASRRLQAIREFTELGSGVRIAMRDLEIRGAGNVLGAEQHGHMEAVGYDMYCKLLNMAVRELKGEDISREEYDTLVDADADAYIPSDYIPGEEQKLDVYKRIASVVTQEDYMDMQDELLDRFGDIPSSVECLLKIARIKALAHAIYITDVKISRQKVDLSFWKDALLNPEKLPELVESYRGALTVSSGPQTVFTLKITGKHLSCDEAISAAMELLIKLNHALIPGEDA